MSVSEGWWHLSPSHSMFIHSGVFMYHWSLYDHLISICNVSIKEHLFLIWRLLHSYTDQVIDKHNTSTILPVFAAVWGWFCVLCQPLCASVPSLLFIIIRKVSKYFCTSCMQPFPFLKGLRECLTTSDCTISVTKQALMNTITDLLSISQQWCQRSGEVRSHVLTSNCEFPPMWMYFNLNLSTENLGM